MALNELMVVEALVTAVANDEEVVAIEPNDGVETTVWPLVTKNRNLAIE